MSKNNATRGGAIYWEQLYPKVDSISSLSRNVLLNFTSNVATFSGGALYLDTVNFYGFVSNLVMDGNQAYYGGAFTIDTSFITLSGTFTNNFASYGAVFCINRTSDATSLTIEGNVRGNSAKYIGNLGHLIVSNSSYLNLDSVYVGTTINFSPADLTPVSSCVFLLNNPNYFCQVSVDRSIYGSIRAVTSTSNLISSAKTKLSTSQSLTVASSTISSSKSQSSSTVQTTSIFTTSSSKQTVEFTSSSSVSPTPYLGRVATTSSTSFQTISSKTSNSFTTEAFTDFST
ncbi:hypothetical protein O9G_006256, partial [Rozella allomycis CSF55]